MYRKIFLFSIILQATTTLAQSMLVYKKSGGADVYAMASIDSLVYSNTRTYETPRSQTSNLSLNISTDSACYHPGSTVTFKFSETRPSNSMVRYMHLGKVINEHPLNAKTWTWQVPNEDFRGYMVQIYVPGATSETIRGTIAVDVSSDWKRFPRYGFVATFGSDKTASVANTEMEWLSRCHINGVQFQDWHYKHHWPWGGKDDMPMASYKDIANRTVYTSSIENYIKAQHDRGMKSIFYNLCYGVLDDAADDGVKSTWYIFQDAAHTKKDYHDLPDSWKSDIYLVDPSNSAWLSYLKKRNEEVYSHLDFDGFQIDQLGYRGTRYKATGAAIDMPTAYATFIKSMKSGNPDKSLVMNAVSSYGSEKIAKTGKVDFLYNEVWDNEANFSHLYDILEANRKYSNGTLQTVFAAYMNYKKDNTTFNTGGVLLTDAVMFALGGSHLELGGDHMLCREYFPYAGLTMSSTLKTSITRYYDFMTAYENLLRDGGTLNTSVSLVPTDTSGKYSINGWTPQLGGITTIAREMEGCTVLHLLNFIKANSLSWRDTDGTMPAASKLANIPLELKSSKKVKHLYVASPDYHGGAMQELEFQQENETLTFTLPNLNYWTMVVINYEP